MMQQASSRAHVGVDEPPTRRTSYGSTSTNANTGTGTSRSRQSRSSLRVPSARSSVAFEDDFRHPPVRGAAWSGGAGGVRSGGEGLAPAALRPASSRFSLNEQFAATRREYEFGDDDGASILTFDRRTLASEVDEASGDEPPSKAEAETRQRSGETLYFDSSDAFATNHYDLLCLARDPSLTPDQIRKAYCHLLLLLHGEAHPDRGCQPSWIKAHLARLQLAFETLIDPVRRARYDCSLESDMEPSEGNEDAEYQHSYAVSLARQLHSSPWWTPVASSSSSASSSELQIGLRASNAVQSLRRHGWQGHGRRLDVRPTDVAISHAVTVSPPRLGPRRWCNWLAPPSSLLWAVDEPSRDTETLYIPPPELTVSGSVVGIVQNGDRVPRIQLSTGDRNHQRRTGSWPRNSVARAPRDNRLPILSFKLSQDLLRRNADGRLAKSRMEIEHEALGSCLTARVAHPVWLRGDGETSLIETSIQSCGDSAYRSPRLELSIRQPLTRGQLFASATISGLGFSSRETCKQFAEFSRLSRSRGDIPIGRLFGEAPCLEVGYASDASGFEHLADCWSSQAVKYQKDEEMDMTTGRWSVSAAVSPWSASGCLGYSEDLSAAGAGASRQVRSCTRLEAELSASTLSGHELSLRNLWRVGKDSALGLEISMTSHAAFLSLHWSRLRHHLSLPLLISSPDAAFAARAVVFWAGIVPFLSVAAWHVLAARRNANPAAKKRRPRTGEELSIYVAVRRTEADKMTVLLAGPVEARQRRRREKGELVILSAKFGVNATSAAQSTGESGSGNVALGAWAAEEVADVTIGVAALVDEQGRLAIPEGVRKERLPGFWDPAPARKKVLHVRYLYNGRERIVEVSGREALVLPLSEGMGALS